MLRRTGKVKGKWERGQTMTVLSLEACLWHLGKKYTMNKMSQADPGPQSPTSCQSQQESTGKPNWGWRFPVRHVSNTTASKTSSQHHVAMRRPKHCRLAVWQPLLMLWSLGRLYLTLSTQKNPEISQNVRGTKTGPVNFITGKQWGVLQCLLLNFFPRALG